MKARGYNSIHSWCIAAGCGFINLMTQGPPRLASLLFVAMLDRYDTDRALASWPFTICLIMKCAPGPLIAYLGEYIGLRYLTLLGAFLAAFGVGLCYFAETMTAVLIFYGGIFGLGMSFANTMMPQILKQHFDKSIARANGLSLSASCLGAVALSPVLKYLLNSYGLSGTFLIMFGVMLNGIPVAYLLRDPKYKKRHVPDKDVIDPERGEAGFRGNKRKAVETNNETEAVETYNGITECVKTDSDRTGTFKANYERSKHVTENGNMAGSVTDKINRTETFQTEIDKRENTGTEINEIVTDVFNAEYQPKNGENNLKRILNESIDEVKFSIGTDEHESKLRTQLFADTMVAAKKVGKFRTALKQLNLFKDPIFIVILVTHSVLVFSANCIFTILLDISRDKGIPELERIYFVMALPAAELTGYLGLGWVTDKGFLSAVNYIALCFFLISVGCGDIVWSTGFFTMLIGVLLIGICSAGISTAVPGMIYEVIDEDKHAMAISSRRVLFTPLSFTVAPMIGYFRDKLGAYDGFMYFNGAMSLACCFSILMIPCLLWRRKTKDRNMQVK